MDFATGVGILSAIGVVVSLIMLDGGNFGAYVSEHAAIVVFGGATAATMIRFPFSVILHGLPMGLRFAFTMRALDPRLLIEELTRIADIVRRNGPMALETVEVEDPFLAQGIRYIADGYDREFIKDALEKDRDSFLMRLDEGSKVYRSIGDCAPAMGMVGTIIGMIAMFAHMEDPSKLGPAMAVALLATLYGAVLSNLICLPIADKLHVKLEEEEVSRTIIIDGVLQIRDAKSPNVIKEMLISYLPERHRAELAEAA